jgi:hypothetical protein
MGHTFAQLEQQSLRSAQGRFAVSLCFVEKRAKRRKALYSSEPDRAIVLKISPLMHYQTEPLEWPGYAELSRVNENASRPSTKDLNFSIQISPL